ncbi:MAG: triose-phosphate isomerase [Bacteroidales bacterium]|jgi:triosephosphate isomerase|nr:triose-phosphate isomerase [Bacteroidales bacterium]
MREKIVAGNWKMNLSFSEAEELIEDLIEKLKKEAIENKTKIILCPSFVYLELATDFAQEGYFEVGGQNVSQYKGGAYTGEVSSDMLLSMRVSYCIVGHSERRKYNNETNKDILEKINQLLENSIKPIFCCGEELKDREEGNHFEVVKKQLEEGLFPLNESEIQNVVIAYEPVWAIGTGKTASVDEAQQMHSFIRERLKERYNEEIAQNISILYGGSCNKNNAKELFSCKDIDGGLIGGASLKAEDFFAIIKSF